MKYKLGDIVRIIADKDWLNLAKKDDRKTGIVTDFDDKYYKVENSEFSNGLDYWFVAEENLEMVQESQALQKSFETREEKQI